MNIFMEKIRHKLYQGGISLMQFPRIQGYRLLSNNRPCEDRAWRHQPALLLGKGEIKMGRCHLGVWPSPYFFNGYIHIEARLPTAKIYIADGVWINNNAVIVAERAEISIGKNTLIGTEFTVYDSDFHDLHPERRMIGKARASSVIIGENVFIGSRVTVLKGVRIGDNSIIAAGSLLSQDIPPNVIVGIAPVKNFISLSKGNENDLL